MDCIFCKIVNGSIPSEKVYEDDLILAFKDINPAAPVHIVIVPKEHIASVMEIKNEHKNLIGHIYIKAQKIAIENGISETGFRIVNNCGQDGGQSVNHIHFHLLGGRSLQWPPG
jgi:histidine triad (HIT) family protein